MAALWLLPIIFGVEKNFGMPGVHVYGMDVFKVRVVANWKWKPTDMLAEMKGPLWLNVRHTSLEDTLWLTPSFVTQITEVYGFYDECLWEVFIDVSPMKSVTWQDRFYRRLKY